ncbi:type II 3-dehydroquinate dehydratase [Gayadomonas joobiniege]|uniref:type II 3-dehydroquinate dehydratase n=1 Tax=Gayadomonas joobiniege TaxID=1234606 RepID=UPI00037C9DD5|nr:type II 3-dehydroquinate dehydratase [Gayadomonas joobiniege]
MQNKKFKVLLLNGPNLNMLGKREPEIYGSTSLAEIVSQLTDKASALNIELIHQQSNAEFQLIDILHQHFGQLDYIIINPAAFTHTSVALRDAILSVSVPCIEVHLSNIHKREAFRHHSYFSDIAEAVICGLGSQGYFYALDAVHQALNHESH